MRSTAVPRSASAPLEDSPGASHVAAAGVRVEMMKIESDPSFHAATNLEVGLVLHFGKKARFYRVFFEIGSSSETSSSARSCGCRAVL